jgi:hypothetical protein
MAAMAELASIHHWGDTEFPADFSAGKEPAMSVILVFVLFVIMGDTAAVGVSYLFERVSNFVSLMVFLALFILVFGVAWKLAVLVTERYILRQN